jgi:hypothetical protein
VGADQWLGGVFAGCETLVGRDWTGVDWGGMGLWGSGVIIYLESRL